MIENQDYYKLSDGTVIFTESYLLEQGRCCGKDCLHCPFDGIRVHDQDESTPSSLIEIQCPVCFEQFGIPANQDDGLHQNFVYDCEICCRPIEVDLDYSLGDVVVMAKLS